MYAYLCIYASLCVSGIYRAPPPPLLNIANSPSTRQTRRTLTHHRLPSSFSQTKHIPTLQFVLLPHALPPLSRRLAKTLYLLKRPM